MNSQSLIVSALGSDQPGIVSEISGVISSHGGNVEESRMSRLGSDFAIIMLVSVSSDWEESLEVALQAINNLTITTKRTQVQKPRDSQKYHNSQIGVCKVLDNFRSFLVRDGSLTIHRSASYNICPLKTSFKKYRF